MSRPRPLVAALIIACGSLLAAAACAGDSTSPHDRARALALHLDTLARVACPPAFSGPSLPSCGIIQAARFEVAQGVLPSLVTVTTTRGSGQWYGSALRTTSIGGGLRADTDYSIVAYDGYNVARGLTAFVPSHGSVVYVSVFADSSLWDFTNMLVAGTGTGTVTTTGERCVPVESVDAPYPAADCRAATMRISLDVLLSPFVGTTGAIHITISGQTFSGIVADSGAAASALAQSLPLRRARASMTPFTNAALLAEP